MTDSDWITLGIDPYDSVARWMCGCDRVNLQARCSGCGQVNVDEAWLNAEALMFSQALRGKISLRTYKTWLKFARSRRDPSARLA